MSNPATWRCPKPRVTLVALAVALTLICLTSSLPVHPLLDLDHTNSPSQTTPLSLAHEALYRRAEPAAPADKNKPEKPIATPPNLKGVSNLGPEKFEILGPEPNEVWFSGSSESVNWDDSEMPEGATLDLTLIPEDPETNPEALIVTRRPFIRYLAMTERYTDIPVPYDVFTKEQVMLEQEGDGQLIPEDEDPDLVERDIEDGDNQPVTPTQTPVIQARARLIMTAYDGKTNKILARRSVFPIFIKRNFENDKRDPPTENQLEIALGNQPLPTSGLNHDLPEGDLEKKDSPMTHMGDHTPVEPSDEKDTQEGGNGDNADNEDNEDDEDDEDDDVFKTPESEDDQEEHEHDDHEHHDTEVMEHDKHDDAAEGEHHHGLGKPGHVIDPNHFQNEADTKIWAEHADEPGYNPPIPVHEAGQIRVTHWNEYKRRFFVGAPYVVAWEFPESGQGLTGTVNVHVEDVNSAKRYDTVASELHSSIQFLYLHPTQVMTSMDPTKRIYLRARIEMDLFKNGEIERYTGFSKTFWVVRGAL
ncbi:hypothetical protein BGW38_004843 [Lunasporangiospora selenospora]|uniref:Uncharacterized protein n=1 Tax=Lunasporangiospora selenospora TaxID=979761 RepID=A0A9P6FPL2_9FUNG|nr:hypothetical protein BGW38_004843 [Lunasporangiospora selenospora]